MNPTAEQIAEALAHPNPPPPCSYEGGIDLTDPRGEREGTVGWKSRHGDVHLTVCLDETFSGFAQLVLRLSEAEWLELRHAGDMAFAAAENHNELRRAG